MVTENVATRGFLHSGPRRGYTGHVRTRNIDSRRPLPYLMTSVTPIFSDMPGTGTAPSDHACMMVTGWGSRCGSSTPSQRRSPFKARRRRRKIWTPQAQTSHFPSKSSESKLRCNPAAEARSSRNHRRRLVASPLPPAASCWSCCFGCWSRCTSSLAVVHLARPTARKPLERACTRRSPSGHDALAVLLGVSCASAQTCAAERRLMVAPLGVHRRVHTSFPCSLK